jgi:hypothetical protein
VARERGMRVVVGYARGTTVWFLVLLLQRGELELELGLELGLGLGL